MTYFVTPLQRLIIAATTAEPKTVPEIMAATGDDEQRGIRISLKSLIGRGLMRRDGAIRYSATEVGRAYAPNPRAILFDHVEFLKKLEADAEIVGDRK